MVPLGAVAYLSCERECTWSPAAAHRAAKRPVRVRRSPVRLGATPPRGLVCAPLWMLTLLTLTTREAVLWELAISDGAQLNMQYACAH